MTDTIFEDGGKVELEQNPTEFLTLVHSEEPKPAASWTHTAIPNLIPPFSPGPPQPESTDFSARSNRKIAVCGSAASSAFLAPFNDPEWEIWSCSPANKTMPRVDVWFELHNPDLKVREGLLEWMQWLKTQPIVYMQRAYSGYPGARQYPLQTMIEKWGPYLWTSQLAFMLALAIEQNPKVIGLYGVDMAANSEYNQQRLACQIFLKHILDSKETALLIPPESDILEPAPFYGYCESSRQWRKYYARKAELQQRVGALKSDYEKKQAEAAHLIGALDDMEYHLAHWATRMDFTE